MVKELRECPLCGCNAKIEVKMPEFGFIGVEIECKNCHCKLQNPSCTETIRDGERLATPITENAMAKCLFDTIRMWNRRSNRANGFIDYVGIEHDAEAWKKTHWGNKADGFGGVTDEIPQETD